jgi:type VI secretion system protein ImpL
MAILYRTLAVAALALIAGFIVWLCLHKRKRTASAEPEPPVQPGTEEIDLAIHDAEKRLSSAKLAAGSRVGNLPVFLLVGDPGTSKTSVILQSGIEPELLSGQVYENSDIVPTRTVNIWFCARSLFVEAGGKLTSDPEMWNRLLRKLTPRATVVGKSQAPPRAAILFYDCENFLRLEAQVRARDEARALRARLGGISQAMGSNLPVYVLFSKMDRLPCFGEYVTNFSDEEARKVFGVTLPAIANRSEGVYAETQTVRLTNHFDQLFCSLADARPKFLARENDTTRLAATYEFPREFRKIRPAAVQFLVELCRPSQLTVSPFLRGFYFTGIRPIAVAEDAPARRAGLPGEVDEAAGATQILQRGASVAALQASAASLQSSHSRMIPQWLFLGNLFREVILADGIGRAASRTNVKTNAKVRIVLASAGIACLLLVLAFTASFSLNHRLASDVRKAAAAISSSERTDPNVASMDALAGLDALRQTLERLGDFRREGPPWSYRFGLYTGNGLYPIVRRLYFARFQEILLDPTQKAIVESLRNLPGTRGPEYGPTYDSLKAYLITTSYHDKSTRRFLTPVLLKWWTNATAADPSRQAVARKQLDFYADELKGANPFSTENDSAVIEKARRYLAQFAGADRVYAFMLADAARHGSPINFNRQFPGSASIVTEAHEVAGAFSKAGWEFMKDARQHADRYVSGERWVLGDVDAAALDPARLEQDLRSRYYADFLREWRLYIKSAGVAPYTDIKDAAAKLRVISGNQSPLLALLSLASRNTAVEDPAVASVFQPVQAVVPPGSEERYIAQSNQNYINALVTLQASLENVTGQSDDPAAAQALNNALQAKVVTRQMAQSFRLDNDGHIEAPVEKLLEDPILGVEQALRGAAPAGMNAGGKNLCSQFRLVTTKFPFVSNSKMDATLDELIAMFRKPDGALWAFYDKNLKKAIVKQGNQYVPSGAVPLNPAFVTFFNKAADLSDALYATGAGDPAFLFTVKPGASDGVQGITFRFDGQTLAYTAGSPPQSKTFTWQANAAHDMTVNVRVGGADFEWQHHTGLWGAFHFFAEAKHTTQGLEWPVGAGSQQFKADGKPVTVRLEVDLGPLGALLQNGMACVAEVTR